ncbi:MAG: transcriptional regulator [Myxococcales bacterium]|nr:transcriptional regulator [Myxococcales bacterium]
MATSPLTDALVQLSFAVQGAIGRVAELHDLSHVQVRLLGILRDREPAMLALAAHLKLDKSSVTGLVDRAEARGLVRRKMTPGDGRTVRVALTERGRKLTQKLAALVEHELAALVGELSAAERKRLLSLAGRIIDGDVRRRLPEGASSGGTPGT